MASASRKRDLAIVPALVDAERRHARRHVPPPGLRLDARVLLAELAASEPD